MFKYTAILHVYYIPIALYTLYILILLIFKRRQVSRDTLYNYWFILVTYFFSTLSVGIGSYVVFINQHLPFRLFTIEGEGVLYFLLMLLLGDFVFYSAHWLSHSVPVLWVSHVVHHNSRELNLSTGYRVTNYSILVYGLPFFLLGLIGFNLQHLFFTFILCLSFQVAFLHYANIPALGLLEYVINTPAKHRVHHAIAPYGDTKNISAMTTFWDLLFGTFQLETQKITEFGVKSSAQNKGLLDVYFSEIKSLWFRVKKQKSFAEKVQVLFLFRRQDMELSK